MGTNGTPNNGGSFSWATIVGLIIVGGIIIGGVWTVVQVQFANQAANIKSNEIAINNYRLRSVSQAEFTQFEKRIDEHLKATDERLLLIEQTRPTAGELKGVADSTKEQIARIIDRLNKIDAPATQNIYLPSAQKPKQ